MTFNFPSRRKFSDGTSLITCVRIRTQLLFYARKNFVWGSQQRQRTSICQRIYERASCPTGTPNDYKCPLRPRFYLFYNCQFYGRRLHPVILLTFLLWLQNIVRKSFVSRKRRCSALCTTVVVSWIKYTPFTCSYRLSGLSVYQRFRDTITVAQTWVVFWTKYSEHFSSIFNMF